MKRLILVLFVLLLSSCVTSRPFNDSVRSFYIERPMEESFSACMNYAVSKGYSITNANKEIGFIDTGYKDYKPDAFMVYNIRLNFVLQKKTQDSTRATLSIYVRWAGNELMVENEKMYLDIIASIKSGKRDS